MLSDSLGSKNSSDNNTASVGIVMILLELFIICCYTLKQTDPLIWSLIYGLNREYYFPCESICSNKKIYSCKDVVHLYKYKAH